MKAFEQLYARPVITWEERRRFVAMRQYDTTGVQVFYNSLQEAARRFTDTSKMVRLQFMVGFKTNIHERVLDQEDGAKLEDLLRAAIEVEHKLTCREAGSVKKLLERGCPSLYIYNSL